MDLSQILEHTLTPMKVVKPTPSEMGDEDSADDFVTNSKHFSRNARLHDEQAVNASVRRSLRLTPSPATSKSVRKTNDLSKVKRSSCRDTAPVAAPWVQEPTPKEKFDSCPKESSTTRRRYSPGQRDSCPKESSFEESHHRRGRYTLY